VLIAVTRAVSPTLAECELTHLTREPIDVARAVAEHACYEEALQSLGATVVHAPPEPTLPDAVFVEDTALVLENVAVLTRPGAATRRRETESIAQVLGSYKRLERIEAPGTVDGGDLLVVGRKVYAGLSSRTNAAGIAQLGKHLSKLEYEVVAVELGGCLHLKSAVTEVADDLLLINADFVRPETFGPVETIAVAPSEPNAANALRIGTSLIYPLHYPETAERLDRAGLHVVPVPCGELAKAEGGVTCCSLVFECC
jgi:dimethylargininase